MSSATEPSTARSASIIALRAWESISSSALSHQCGTRSVLLSLYCSHSGLSFVFAVWIAETMLSSPLAVASASADAESSRLIRMSSSWTKAADDWF